MQFYCKIYYSMVIVYTERSDILDTIERIKQLMDAHGWTKYRLGKESGLAKSTITNIFSKNTVPSVFTLEAICKAFNITLAQFYAEGDMVELTPELESFFNEWKMLTPEQKEAVLHIMKIFNNSTL